jgi:hypothetical protein
MQGKRGLRNLVVSQLLYHRDLNPGDSDGDDDNDALALVLDIASHS